MENNGFDYEETFQSESQEEIDKERNKKRALMSLFPKQLGTVDNTKYVLQKTDINDNDIRLQKPALKKENIGLDGNNVLDGNEQKRITNYTGIGKQTIDNFIERAKPQRNTNHLYNPPFISENQKAEVEAQAKAQALYESNRNRRENNIEKPNYLTDALFFATGGYAPHRPVKIGKTPWGTDIRAVGPISTIMNYLEMNDIDNWERENEKRNKEKREKLNSMKEWPITRQITNTYEKIMNVKELREAAFPTKSMTHLIAAIDNGLGVGDGDNIASVADRFANKYDEFFVNKNSEYKSIHHIDKARNTLRHTIWQATLASQYNPQVAYDAAMAHETRPYADTSQRIFYTESEADTITDLLNNRIGRKLGHNNKKTNIKEIALLVLDEFWKNGLYTYEKGNDGLYYIVKKKMSDQNYIDVYNSILKLNNNGRE